MYLPAFGSPAAIHLAERYHCEWLQDVHSPTTTPSRRSSNVAVENDYSSNSRIFHQHQSIGDDDEFVVTFQAIHPAYSCPNLTTITHERLRERSFSLTTLDAYARLDITRDTLEQMWLSLLDLAFSDRDDVELGEYKLRHIRGLSTSYSNMNETIIEKSRSHGDIFSTSSKNEHFTTKKSRSFDVTSLPKSKNHESANVGLLEGAAISEPFVDRICLTSTHSDTEPNLLDIDNESMQSSTGNPDEDENHQQLSTDEVTSPPMKEPLNYIFQHPNQLYGDDDEYDLEQISDLRDYLPERTLTNNEIIGEEDQQLYTALSSDFDEAPAVLRPIDPRAELENYQPHSLSTIPSSRASQYAPSLGDSDEIDYAEEIRRGTLSFNQEPSIDEREATQSDRSSPAIHSHPQTPPEPIQVRTEKQQHYLSLVVSIISTSNVSISSQLST